MMEEVRISTEYISLDAMLKFANICVTGGHAKVIIAEGGALVNGVVCFERGRKLRPGDTVTVERIEYLIEKQV